MKVMVLGYGNEFRQDDRVGHELAPRLHRWLVDREVDAELWLGSQLLPELADDLSRVDLAVFVDASMEDQPEGYACTEVRCDPSLEGFNIHSMGAPWLLSLMEDLGYPRPEAVLVSVTGRSFDFGETLSDECRRSTESAEAAFRRWWTTRVN